jgi:phage terminase large subunit-like protein
VALVAETAADARDVMTGDGKPASDPTAGSGILQVHPKAFRPTYEPSKRRLTWPNGAIATLYNAVEPDQLRGPNHDAAWCDELAKWAYAQETWDNLQFGLRQGSNPRCLVTTTPRPLKIIKDMLAERGTVVTVGSTYDNSANLAPSFLARLKRIYEGTRLGRQELEADLLEDVDGALWSREVIDRGRVKTVPALRRIVVAIDPAASSGEDSDETGIIVAGRGEDNGFYVLADVSGRYAPHEWAATAVRAFRQWRADRIVAERNNGGEMVEATIRMVDADVPVTTVWASRGKVARAEPVSALYEQGRAHHVGAFPALEDQMCAMTADFDARSAGYSPDRCDALVWAATELVVERGDTGLLEYYRELYHERLKARG